jgi:hypothetical protein
MDSLSTSKIKRLQETYGPIFGCQLDFVAFEISEDLGELSVNGEKYNGYVISYGSSYGPHLYRMIDKTDNNLPQLFNEIHRNSDDPDWPSGRERLLHRLRRLTWSTFVGGESCLPSTGSPLDDYPGDGGQWIDEMLRPELENGSIDRNAEEVLYIEDPKAWYKQVGFPCAAAGWGFPDDWSERYHVACFVTAIKTQRDWSLHSGDTEKIAHLFEDQTKDQFLGSLDEALTVFDTFEGQDLAIRCLSTRHRAKLILLHFANRRFLTFTRLPSKDKTYNQGHKCSGGLSENYAEHSCCLAKYQLTTDDGKIEEVVEYDQIVDIIESWKTAINA